jgi:hypothetical protein
MVGRNLSPPPSHIEIELKITSLQAETKTIYLLLPKVTVKTLEVEIANTYTF